MPADPTDPLIETVLGGRYRIRGRIAQGGMATVYLAHDERLERDVAVKVMHSHLAGDEEFQLRFIQEAKSAARLAHPHVVSVLDQGVDRGYSYLVMEFIDGQTLRALLRDYGRLRVREALDILVPVLDALGAAHRAGYVHRDVKPENVLIGADGRVKVADFGLARAITSASAAASGSMFGTVAYIAPELLREGAADARSDVYSLGVVVFEMLTGRQPFTSDIPMQVAFKHAHEPMPRPSTLVKTVPADVDALVAWMCAKDPAERPGDARAVHEHVRELRRGLSDATLNAYPLLTATNGTEAVHTHTAQLSMLEDSGEHPTLRSESWSAQGTETARGRPDARAEPDSARAAATPRTSSLPTEAITVARAVDPPTRRQRRRAPRGLGFLALLLILVGGGTGAWYLVSGPGAYTSVPQVIGANSDDARKLVVNQGLSAETTTVFSEDAAKDQVISATPAQGADVRKASVVRLVISKGPERYGVPEVVGLDAAAARKDIEARHLAYSEGPTAFSDTVAKGEVISQQPTSGQVERGTTVTVNVSKGQQPVAVPNLVGKPAAAPAKKLEAAGLALTTRKEFSDSVEKGAVISQDPATGDLFKGDSLELVVSKGPDIVTVPDFGGKSRAEATKAAEGAGVDISFASFPGAKGSVVAQLTPAGKQVKRGTTVRVVLL